MEEESYLLYEQEDVHFICEDSETSNVGRLRLYEKGEKPILEWVSNSDIESYDSDWALISSSPESPNVSFTNNQTSDSVSITPVRKGYMPYSLQLEANFLIKVIEYDATIKVLRKNGVVLATFTFSDDMHISFFMDVVNRYYGLRKQERDASLVLLQDKYQADLDDKLSALNLVPNRSPKTHHKSSSSRNGGRMYSHHHHHHHQYWTTEAPKRVWGFINNMKRDPYTTTLSTLSKFYDNVLYGDYYEEGPKREDSEEVNQFLQSISGFDDLEPGFEILTKKEDLAERPTVERLEPLLHEEFKAYVDSKGRINDVESLKERIFRGGLVPTLREEVWCYLLGLYDWNMTFKEKEERKKLKEKEYFVMKKQWKSFTEIQERNFSGYRDRKSLIEKDVNRTDRNHPFYEGESNPNLETLNDILMTYVLYNFDLGYVQGMSDLLAPLLYVIQNESVAFWCFVGYMEIVYRNFDLDQSGMKQQLTDLSQILRVIDPEFSSFLEAQDSSNFYFCFRWILVRFKRELNYQDTLRLWEVLWTQHLCPNFHLLVAASILDTERKEIIEKKLEIHEVLRHVNSLSLKIDLEAALKKAEAIYIQLSRSPSISNSVRKILCLPLVEQKSDCSSLRSSPDMPFKPGFPGRAERINEDCGNNSGRVTDSADSAAGHLATSAPSQNDEEIQFENSITHSFL